MFLMKLESLSGLLQMRHSPILLSISLKHFLQCSLTLACSISSALLIAEIYAKVSLSWIWHMWQLAWISLFQSVTVLTKVHVSQRHCSASNLTSSCAASCAASLTTSASANLSLSCSMFYAHCGNFPVPSDYISLSKSASSISFCSSFSFKSPAIS